MSSSAGPAPPDSTPAAADLARSPASPRRGRAARGARIGSGVVLFFRVMRANPLTFAGFVLVVLILGAAVLVEAVPFLTNLVLGHAIQLYPYDPNSPNPSGTLLPPSGSHWMGTDFVGEDIFSRVLAALPVDLFIGISIAGASLLVGGGLGLVAGFWDDPRSAGGILSVGILRVTDVFLSFPSLVLALAIAASLGRGTYTSMLAVFATWWPFYVRLTRGEVLVIKQQPYITAARAAGVSEPRILVRHVLRNLIEPLLVYFTLDIGTVIVTYSTISFIGVGVPASVPEWGNMIERYQDFLVTQPYMVGFVALAIFLTVLAFSLLGDGLRDLLDPRSRRVLASVGVSRGAPAPASAPLAGEEA
jgi:peptide/nickel transport system permease protein